jgi:myo-inositol-1(or 4)-monophosphatase
MPLDLAHARATAEAAAIAAGDVVMRYFNQPHEETEKSNVYDVVTEGDKASEAALVPFLRAAFPHFAILSEEGGGQAVADAEYTWVIDPIDGTTNFAANLPLFSISIGLVDSAMRPVVGVVYNPVYRELFSAADGHGASLNGAPIRVTSNTALHRALLSTGFPYRRHTLADNNLRQFEAMLMQVRDIRRIGSAALDLAFTAAGRLDGFWEKHINAWDVVAGICLVREAGGTITDYAGTTERLYTGAEVVATTPALHAEVLAILNR